VLLRKIREFIAHPIWIRTLLVAGWAAIFLLMARTVLFAFHRPAYRPIYDLSVYVGAVRGLAHGHSLYDFAMPSGVSFTYPPFAGLVLLPLGMLPIRVTHMIWITGILCAFVAAAWFVSRRFPQGRKQQLILMSGILALLVTEPGFSNIKWGQISFFLILLVLIDGLKCIPARYRGIATGVAAAIKLTPLIFIPYFWCTGDRRAAIRSGVTFIACTCFAVILLPTDSQKYWLHKAIKSDGTGDLASYGNRSLMGMLQRAEIDRPVILWAAVSVAIAGLAYWRARKAAQNGEVITALAIVGCAGLAISPISWEHHQAWLLLAIIAPISIHFRYNVMWGLLIIVATTISIRGSYAIIPAFYLPVTTHLTAQPFAFLIGETRTLLAIAIATFVPFVAIRSPKSTQAIPHSREPISTAGIRRSTARAGSRIDAAANEVTTPIRNA
jgi:alpha-1,2-mannosyltransferase